MSFAMPGGLETPALVVDERRLDANIERMAARASAAHVTLRPHAKTHKCPPIGRRQLAAGAPGLTVATLDEAELFVSAGCDDVFIAYPLWVDGRRAGRVRELHERVRLRVGVDNADAAAALAAATRGAAEPLRVLVEVECGARRSGVRPDLVAALATACRRAGLDVRGAFTHPGHAYAGPDAVGAAGDDERTALAAAGEALDGIVDGAVELSGGSTPTVLTELAAPVTDARPGTYVFGDRQQLRLGVMTIDDVALMVAATVVSTPRAGEVVLDAGSKALSSDRPGWLDGFGWMPAHPGALVAAVTEQHSVVTGLTGQLRVGDVVGVVPNHVCTAVNLGREIIVVDHGAVVDRWSVGRRS